LNARLNASSESYPTRLAFNPAGAFVFVGLDPNATFMEGKVDLDRWGFIETDGTLQTSMRGVFAAGDVRAGSTKQLGAVVGEGVTALLMIHQHLERVGDVAEHAAG